jgi:hypothetical protein
MYIQRKSIKGQASFSRVGGLEIGRWGEVAAHGGFCLGKIFVGSRIHDAHINMT